jgi:hypothetical protein
VTGVWLSLFISGLLYGAVSSSSYIVSNGRMTKKQLIGKDMEESDHVLI